MVISFLEDFLKSSENPLSVAEIGVGIGATSVEIVKRLRNIDSFYFFSFEEDVVELNDDLKNAEYCKCNLDTFMETDEEWERIGDINWQTGYRKIIPDRMPFCFKNPY